MKALELAKWLSNQANCEANEIEDNMNDAAAELRRLAELNEELLVALKELVAQNETSFFAYSVSSSGMKNARAAIIKAKEQQ